VRPLAARLVLLVCLSVVAAACQSTGSPTATGTTEPRPAQTPEAGESPTDSGTLRYALGEPSAIVPVEAVGSAALTVVDALFDSLTAWAASGQQPQQLQVRPSAAVDWSTEDGRVWTFRLRPRAMFHDGATPVTAWDFVFAWEQAVRLDEVGYHLREVEGYEALRTGEADALAGVTAIDEHTLEVRLSSPNADFPAVVGHPALGPLPRTLWQADPEAFRRQPVGNGPFVASEPWARGQFLRVTPFDAWRNRVARPSVTEVVFQFMDAETAYLAFQQGRLDFAELPPGALTDAAEHYEESPDGYTGPGLLRGDVPVLYYLGVDVTRPPFDDVEVRRALSLAVDRAAIAGGVLEGNVTAARSLLPPTLPGPGTLPCQACRHDPEAATAIFADRGITNLVLWFNRGGGHERIARQLRRDLHAVGVRLELHTEEFPEYLAALSRGEPNLFRFGWAVDYPTLDNALYPILHSSAIGSGDGAHNHGRYAAGDVDALLDEARATLDTRERQVRYAEAADLALNRDQAIVPLFTYRHAAVASDRTANLVYDPMGFVDLVSVEIVDPGDS